MQEDANIDIVILHQPSLARLQHICVKVVLCQCNNIGVFILGLFFVFLRFGLFAFLGLFAAQACLDDVLQRLEGTVDNGVCSACAFVFLRLVFVRAKNQDGWESLDAVFRRQALFLCRIDSGNVNNSF